MPTDTEYWRAAVVVVVTDAVAQLVASGKMAQRMFDDERLEAFNAQPRLPVMTLPSCVISSTTAPTTRMCRAIQAPGRDGKTTGATSSFEQQ